MTKYTHEQKMKAILDVTERHMTYYDVGRLVGCGHAHIRRWVKMYEQFGEQGLTLKHGAYTGEFKQNVIEHMRGNNLSLFETATLFGIPTHTTVAKWERIYYEEGPQALYSNKCGRKQNMLSEKPKEEKLAKETEEDLIAEVQMLRIENAYLKKLNALVQERIARENVKK